MKAVHKLRLNPELKLRKRLRLAHAGGLLEWFRIGRLHFEFFNHSRRHSVALIPAASPKYHLA
jgi:hypothetical protein